MKSSSTPMANDYFSGLQTPNIKDMELQLEELVSQGTITPQEAQTFLQDPSAFNSIETDPELQKAQMAALSQLQEIGSEGGLTKTDRAKLNQIKSQEDAANRGQREAIMQRAQARGMGGSGLEIASQLQNQQDSATRQAQRDMDVGALAEQRALDAILQGGNLAGSMQNTAFNQQAQKAEANDAISRFNTQNRQSQANLNTGNMNAAQEANLMNRQKLSDANVGLRNQAQISNKQLPQQQYNNELAKRQGQQGVATSNAQTAGANNAANAAANNQNIALGAGLASGGVGYLTAAELAKKKQQGQV